MRNVERNQSEGSEVDVGILGGKVMIIMVNDAQ